MAKNKQSPPKIYYGWYIVVAMIFIGATSATVAGPIFGFFIEPMQNDLGFDNTVFGLANTGRMLAAAFGGLFIGKLLDKHGPRVMLAVAGMVSGLAIISLGFFHPAWWLIGVFVITGVVGVQGQAPFYTGPSVAKWFIHKRAKALMAQGKTEQLSKDMSDVEETLRASLKELRQVLSGLRPPALEELGLTHAIIRDLERLEETGVSCSTQMEGSPMRMPLDAEIATYRVVQEGLNNIRKHAKAGEARVRLEFGERELSIRIKDNGSGFNTAEALEGDPAIGHLGLLGMKQRVEGLGGTIRISSKIGLGTTVDIRLPIDSDAIDEEAPWMASA